MKTITLKVPDALVESIDAVAEERGSTRSEVIREAMAVYGAQARRPRDRRVGDSLGDLLLGLEGASSQAPADLSTNKAYLTDLGHDSLPDRRHRPARRSVERTR